MSRPVTFTLPRSFDPCEFLPLRLLTRADDARWLIDTILRKTANYDTDPWGYVRLNLDIVRRTMYQETAVEIVRALEHGGAIETAGYSAGRKPKGYRLTKRYGGDRCVRRTVMDARLLDRIDRERQRLEAEERQSRRMPIHDRLNDEQRRLTITDDAQTILDGLPDHTRLCQDVLVSRILRREFRLTVGTTRRAFNNITGLKRELRSALRIGGESLGSVDIKCAQPGLLAIVLTHNIPPSRPKWLSTYKHAGSGCPASLPCLLPPLPPVLAPLGACLGDSADIADFCDLASSGLLYERLVSLSGLDRDTVKLAFLRDVLAKRGQYPSAVEDAFRAEFPTVHQAIRFVNRADHGELIRLLQRMEAWLVVETVSPRLVGRVPVVTLHDAIYTTAESLPVVESAFNETFAEIGCRLSLKMDR